MTLYGVRQTAAAFSDTFLSEQRRRLLAERTALMSPPSQGDIHVAPQATTGQGETDHITAETQRLLEAALDEHTRLALDEIAAALTRLETGTYGSCQRCGDAIGEARLDALPRARYCIECQRLGEALDTQR